MAFLQADHLQGERVSHQISVFDCIYAIYYRETCFYYELNKTRSFLDIFVSVNAVQSPVILQDITGTVICK